MATMHGRSSTSDRVKSCVRFRRVSPQSRWRHTRRMGEDMHTIASSSHDEGYCRSGGRGALAILYLPLFERALARLAFQVTA
jgi:hypothetical protein